MQLQTSSPPADDRDTAGGPFADTHGDLAQPASAAPRRVGLWDITRGQRLRYVGAIAALGLANVFMFGVPLLGKLAMDRIQAGSSAEQAAQAAVGSELGAALAQAAAALSGSSDSLPAFLWTCGAATVLLTMCAGVFHYLRGKHAAIAAEGIARAVRERLYDQLQHLPASYHDAADTGDLVQRCSSDVETLRVFLASDIVEIGRALLLLATVTPILFWLDARLAWVSLALMPLIFGFSWAFFHRIKGQFKVADEAEAEMTTTLQENLTGIRVVRAFARQAHEVERFGVRNARFRDLNNRLIQSMGYFWAGSDLLSMGQIALVLGAGAIWLADGSLSVGTLFAFLTYESMVIWPIRQMGRILTDSGKATVALGRIEEVLGAAAETTAEGNTDTANAAAAPGPGRARGALAFTDVRFGYTPERTVLDALSFSVAAGETLAIVGPPGAGKSTVIRLLLRLYDPQQGSITLDGRDIRTLDRRFVRAQFGVVLQEPFLYSRSIGENLRVGRPGADSSMVLAATRDAAIHDSIAAFPEGYEAMVGERGITLSGGQRQRVALARALLRDPPILVLDDALSAVDTGTERHILTALRRRKGRQTTLVIAHRLTSVMHADRILVLEAGRIAQLGTHDELVAVPGPYRRLCEIQGDLEAGIDADVGAPGAQPTGAPR
jgi:ATP-binding cassette subfamily B protein